MMIRYRSPGRRVKDTPQVAGPPPGGAIEEEDMRWETPRAIDFRFGMEITLYIANR